MPTLSFPSSPSLNDTYTFGGKTWVWNGSYWALQSNGAINGIVIGNVTPATGAFTTLTSTGNTTLSNIAGNLIPVANLAYSLGNATNQWANIYVGGNTIFLGGLQLKDDGGNTLGVYAADGTTPATLAGNVTASDIVGTVGLAQYVTEAAQGNITSVGTLTSLSVTGNVTAGNLSGTSVLGTLVTASQPNITTVGALGSLSVTGNVTAGNVSGTYLTGTLLTSSQPNITSIGQLASLGVTGNVIAGNLSGTNLTGTLTTAAQTNITSIGTLTTLTVSGNINTGSNINNTGANGTGNIGSSTTYFNTVFAKATSAQYADLAEVYVSDVDYPAGTVVVFGGQKEITQSTAYAQMSIAGVISTHPAHIMNAGSAGLPVALQGRVPCRVMGVIRKGDLVTSSEIAGVATRLDPADWIPGSVIGKALEDHDDGEGVIEVVVGRV